MKTLNYLVILTTSLFSQITLIQESKTELYRERARVNGASLDLLKFTKELEKEQPYNRYVFDNKAWFLINNKDYCEACKEIKKYKNDLIYVNSRLNKYYETFCFKEDEIKNKEIKKMFTQKKCTSFPEYKQIFTSDDSLRGLLSDIRDCYDVNYYDLDIKFNIKDKSISGSNTIYFKLLNKSQKLQFDAHRQLNISKISMANFGSLNFERLNDVIIINLPNNIPTGFYNIKIEYNGTPANAINPPWEGGFIWKKHKGKTWAGVTCEHLGASFWWPCKDHPSDEPDSMRTHFTVPNNLEIVSNGNLESVTIPDKNLKTYNWKISYPINTYNVTFYIGNFVHYTTPLTTSFGTQYLEHYVLPKNLKKAKKHYPIEEEIVTFYEKVFGEFPFKKDGFCLVESPYEGMEHQTAIAIGTKYGKEKRYVKVKDDYLIIHEAAHEWWGNSVTANDMAHAWIQEGFATYAELLFIENKYGHDAYIEETMIKEFGVFNFWPVVGNENVNDNTFISGDIYDKGALFLHSLRSTIDDDTIFFKIIKTFAERYKYKMVVTNDFLSIVNEFTQQDYSSFFKSYLYQTDVPTLEYSYNLDPSNDKIIFKYKWTNVPTDFKMPFAMKDLNDNYFKLIATTNWKTIKIDKDSHRRFVLGNDTKNCPKNYTTFHYCRMTDN